jgi:DNA-directed RNA polymerase specialized sigma24 family protein
MNANYRSALVLRDIYGFAYEEVASTLHISLSAAKIRIYRARLDFKSRYRALVGTKEKKHDAL